MHIGSVAHSDKRLIWPIRIDFLYWIRKVKVLKYFIDIKHWTQVIIQVVNYPVWN